MYKRIVYFFIFSLVFVLSVFSQQETDFQIESLDNGRSIRIIGYTGTIKTIIIPRQIQGINVTEIWEGAFRGKQLTSVTIPNGIITIGNVAFADNFLTSISIPSSVTTIMNAAFSGNRITSVNIPASVTNFMWHVFMKNQLANVTIPFGWTAINNRTFSDNLLTSITIPNSVEYIEAYAFSSNRLTSVIIPDSVIYIDEGAFANNQLTNVVISNNVTRIGMIAFMNNQLTNITIPNSVTKIGIGAFAGNQLTSITIDSNVVIEQESGVPTFENGFADFYNASGRNAGTYTYRNGVWYVQLINQGTIVTAIPSIIWAYGDTISTLRTRNLNHNFRLDNDGSVKSYVVTEGREPTITETTFIFRPDGRLGTVIYRKVGAALDIYNPLFEKYRTIYGSPNENVEFGINQHQTNLNGFLVYTGNSRFENSRGSVNLLVVVPTNKVNLPYVLLTESYVY
jgi:hypothetical protein